MKYLFLIFAVTILLGVVSIKAERNMLDNIFNYIRGVVVILTSYLAGRLNRYKENRTLGVVVIVLMFATSLLSVYYLFFVDSRPVDFWNIFNCFDSFILCVDLLVAYLFRYKEHIAAGLNSHS